MPKLGSRTQAQIFTQLYEPIGDLPRDEKQTVTWYQKVRLMRRNPTIALIRNLSAAPMIAADWSYEVKDGVPDGAADLIEEEMSSVKTHLLRSTILGCYDFGWQPFEKVFYVANDGFIRIKKMKPLLHDITDILVFRDGSFAGFQQERDSVTLDLEECLLMNINVEGTNWFGEGFMRNVEAQYDAYLQTESGAARYNTRVSGSHWIVYYPLGTSMYDGTETDNYVIAQEILGKLQSSSKIAVPRIADEILAEMKIPGGSESGWKIDLISDKGTSQSSFLDRLRYLDSLFARGWGWTERSILEGQMGTKAEAGIHGDMSILAIDLQHDMFCQAFNWHLVNQLLRINFGSQFENTVRIKPGPITDSAKQFMSMVYEKLLSSSDGMANELLSLDLDVIRESLGLPTAQITSSGIVEDMTDVQIADDMGAVVGQAA